MTRVALLVVWLAIAGLAAIAMTLSLTAGDQHWFVTWANTGAWSMIALQLLVLSRRQDRWDAVLGAWRVAPPREDDRG